MSAGKDNTNLYLGLLILIILAYLYHKGFFKKPNIEKSKIVHKDINELFYIILKDMDEKREITMKIRKISEENSIEQERLLNEITPQMENNKNKMENNLKLYYSAYDNLIIVNPTNALAHANLVGAKYKEREELMKKIYLDLQNSSRTHSNNLNIPNDVYLYSGVQNAKYLKKENEYIGKIYIDIYTKLLQKNQSLIHKYKKHLNSTIDGPGITGMTLSVEDAMIKCQAGNLINKCIAFTVNNGDVMLYDNKTMSVSAESGKDVYTWD